MTTAIDLFAGAGGSSTGAAMAGARVIWAGNHSPLAISYHLANHPETAHVCQDLQQYNFAQCPDHDIMMASPCCQGHSNARGKGHAGHDASRSTAWAVVSAAEAKKPPVIIVENVPEFQRWVCYPSFVDALNRLGYAVSPHIVDAADLGVPQNRVRLFLVCTRTSQPLLLSLPKLPHKPASSVINLDAGTWSPVNKPGRSEYWKQHMINGTREFGGNPFILYYFTNKRPWRSMARPIGAITTIDHHYVVNKGKVRPLTTEEKASFMGFRTGYKLPQTKMDAGKLLGNAVCPPVMMHLIQAVEAQG